MRQPALYVGARPWPLLRVSGRRRMRKGLLGKVKPRAFMRFARAHGEAALLDRLEAGERDGMVYHRVGVEGDYDAFPSAEALIAFLESGCRPPCANGGKMV